MSTQTVLKERGDDVLAAGSDQELLLAAGDPQEPFVVELSNVVGVEPSVYQGPAGGCLVVAVGREDVVALDQDLTVICDLDRDTRQRPADGADLDQVRGVHVCRCCGLGESVALEHGEPDAAVEMAQTGSQRGAT